MRTVLVKESTRAIGFYVLRSFPTRDVNRWSPGPRYPGLFNLAAGSFNPEWTSFHATAQDVVASFKMGAGNRLPMAIADLDAILASPMRDEELDDLWSYELMGAYEPTNDGFTYREWFTELRRFFSE